jgi:hypothetical protein
MSADRGPSVSLGTANDEIDVLSPAPRADQPCGPFLQRQLGAVALDLLGNIGLDLMPARLAPND